MSTNPPTAPHLRRRSGSSYHTNDEPGFVEYAQHVLGYTLLPTRSALEYARLGKELSLLACYHSGAILRQQDINAPRELLKPLVVEEEPEQARWVP